MSTSRQLDNLRRKTAFYQHDAPAWVKNFWPRQESFDWFIKHHRDALIEQGALVKLGRDYFIDTAIFPEAASRVLGVEQGEGNCEPGRASA